MKRLLIPLLFILGVFAGTAQAGNAEIYVAGVALDTAGNPVPNLSIEIDASGNAMGGANTVTTFTDSSGTFIEVVQLDSGVTFTPNVTVFYSSCQNPGQNLSIGLGSAADGDTIFAFIFSDCPGVPVSGGGSCHANFRYNAYGDTVVFTNVSSGSNNFIYSWDFGDSTTSTSSNPTHIYPSTPLGFYFACLTVTDTVTGCTDTYCQTIAIGGNGGNCSANFYSQSVGLTVDFIATSGGFPTGSAIYEWILGDGSIAYGPNIQHTYAQAGTYPVCLILNDTGFNCVDTLCRTLVVSGNNSPCAADFTYFNSNDTVAFFNTSSAPSGASLLWDFGDGTTSTDPIPVHIYNGLGTYNVCLTISDSAGNCTDTKCQLITLTNNTPTCQALFTYNQYGDTVEFVDNSTSQAPAGSLDYYWDFGDGNFSSQQNPNHIYNSGVYNACLTISDSLSACYSTYCVIIFVGNNGNNCDASFTQLDLGGGLIQFFDSGITIPGQTEFWDFGDGNSSTQANPTHLYAQTGLYTVTRIVSANSGSGFCSDTASQLISVSVNNPNCMADFMVNYDTLANTLEFSAINPLPGQTFFWDLGDGTTATGAFVAHTYASAGSYNVCLTLTDTSGCSDSICKITPTLPPPNVFGVLGIVNLPGGAPALDFTAYLVVLDSAAGTLTAVDTFVSDPSLGPFFFFAPPNGDYRVKVALNPGDPNYANYLPTYYGDDPFWYNATVVNQLTFPLLDITMVGGSNPGGPGFIGGLISQGANRTTTNMVENIAVVLTDMNDAPLDYAVTNVSGEFRFENLAEGRYKVLVDMWGRTTEYYEVEISQGKTTVENINFEFNDVSIWKAVPTNVAPELEETVKIYPNPATSFVNVELGLKEAKELKIVLINSLGQELMSQNSNFAAGTSVKGINLVNMPRGMYQIAIFEDGKPILTERIVLN
ncbi:MAG: PKD domain-containing protein [Bacteroidia bacterium]|nr:PKD domain-containing protein [Bacteroidia bacterium]